MPWPCFVHIPQLNSWTEKEGYIKICCTIHSCQYFTHIHFSRSRISDEMIPLESSWYSSSNSNFGRGSHVYIARWGIWEVARLGDFITRNQFFYYKCYICWKFKPIFALSYSQILRWPHAGAIISLQVQKKSAWMAWNNVWRFLWSPNVHLYIF